MLKAPDLFRVERLFEHCVEPFGRGLTVDTVTRRVRQGAAADPIGDAGARSEGPVQEMELGGVSAGALRVVLALPLLPDSGERGA